MSSRKSSSSGEGLPPGRTPLRSVENEVLHLSTPPSGFKSKSQLSADSERKTKGEVPLYVSGLQLEVIQSDVSISDMTATETSGILGDVTSTSFSWPGGEVEIAGSLECTEESIILPSAQAVKTTYETEDTFISGSMIIQACSDHIDHDYCNPRMEDTSQVETDADWHHEMSNTAQPSGALDDTTATQNSGAFQQDVCGESSITWKSFACDGGEVEVSDVTRLQDETIPLPREQFAESLQDSSIDSVKLSAFGLLCPVEHADHPYSNTGNDVCVMATSSETTDGSEEPATALSNVTFKCFNCTGGEVEISDAADLADETVPLPCDQTAACSVSVNDEGDTSIFASDQDGPRSRSHFDHLYCPIESDQSPRRDQLTPSPEPAPFSLRPEDEHKEMSSVLSEDRASRQEDAQCGSSISTRVDVDESDESPSTQLLTASPSPAHSAVLCQSAADDSVATAVTPCHSQDDEKMNSCLENVADAEPPVLSTSSLANTSLKSQSKHQMSPKDSTHSEDSVLPLLTASASPTSAEEPLEHVSPEHLGSGAHESCEAKDSALGSLEHGAALCNSAEKPQVEGISDALKVLSECPSVVSALQFFSPAVRRASQSLFRALKNPAEDLFLAENFALEAEKSSVAPDTGDPCRFWPEHLESPMPRPLFNSTVLGSQAQPSPVCEPVEDVGVEVRAAPPEGDRAALDAPLIPEGSLQQQLRQMAEFLFLASGKVGPGAASTPLLTVLSAQDAPPQSHSVCVGTSPPKWANHSVNTSGQFEPKRDFSVADSCTLTDPLLWNVPPGSLECLSKQELEQRLRSSMIMVEALVQQLAAARTHACTSTSPAPSDLREKLVQTDHTELSQTTMHRELYLEALSRIEELELDSSTLQDLLQSMQDMKVTMNSLSCDTDATLFNMKLMEDAVREDHQSLVSHYGQMKSLLEKTKETQAAMMQKVRDAFLQRDAMRTQMEEAITAKEAAFAVMEQLRTHCATDISELERVLGSQEELLAVLNHTYPEQVALNRAYTETLSSVTDVLSTTAEEQSSLMKELCTVRGLLQKTAPVLLQLNEKAAAAVRERDHSIAAREQAVEEREQMEEEWNQTNINLETAREQISDLNLQVTILTSEMGVLRQKLTEREEERGQLERKVTELSATVSSTLASYTFLEQALAAESTKLQQSWKDVQLAKDRAEELEQALGQSEQRVSELSQALAVSEEQVAQLQGLSQSQSAELEQLHEVCTQLSGVQEMNEFLQMENELAREQMAKSENMLKTNLQGLRERNIQCEDLRGELGQLQLENSSLREEMETVRARASETQLELEEKLAQMVTEVTLLLHRLRGLTDEQRAALDDQSSDAARAQRSGPAHVVGRRHPTSSFVNSVMHALTAEKEEDVHPETPPGADEPEPECGALFSKTSAFTRIEAVTPKKAAELEDPQSDVEELFADLDATVTELISCLKLVQQRSCAQLEELHGTICGLRGEQQAASSRHQAEVYELQRRVERLSGLAEKGSQVLQQKDQDEKTIAELTSAVHEMQETLHKYKTDSNDLRKEVGELRRSLQQSKVESQVLRQELEKGSGQSALAPHFMEEKIQLLKEVDRLKSSLQGVELARAKLLERAKRHQIIHQTNQQKSEMELQMLSKMINKIREMLLSLPEVLKRNEQLQQLVEYIG